MRPLAVILVLASATSAALVGCGGTAEDEVPTAGNGSGAAGGTGGSGTAGSTGIAGSGTGGAAGSAAGGAPTAGAAGSGAGSTGLPDVGCDYVMALSRSCAISGCHNSRQISGDLDLTADAGLRSRLVDVPAKHSMIVCDPSMLDSFCVPAACPTNAKLLDSANPDASWLFAKIGLTPTGCGDQMPMAPGNAADRWTEANQTCLQTFFRALAGGGPAPGSGGTGSGGSSGASTGGSAGSAAGGVAGTTSGGGGATGGAGASSGGNAGALSAGSGGASAGSGQGGANGGVTGSL